MLFKTVSNGFMIGCISLMAIGCSDDTAVQGKNVFGDNVTPQQKAFCELINDYRARYESVDGGPNFIDKENTLEVLFQERTNKLQQQLSLGVVRGWSGVINGIISEQGVSVGLKVRLSCDAELYTGDEFMIRAGTSLYNALRQYKEGGRLVFSGRFIVPLHETREYPYQAYYAETSLTHRGSIKYPEFYFEFTGFE